MTKPALLDRIELWDFPLLQKVLYPHTLSNFIHTRFNYYLYWEDSLIFISNQRSYLLSNVPSQVPVDWTEKLPMSHGSSCSIYPYLNVLYFSRKSFLLRTFPISPGKVWKITRISWLVSAVCDSLSLKLMAAWERFSSSLLPDTLLLARVSTRSSCSADSSCGLHFCYTSSILKLKLLTGALYSGYHSVFLMIFFLIPVKCYSSISVTMIHSECCYVVLMWPQQSLGNKKTFGKIKILFLSKVREKA